MKQFKFRNSKKLKQAGVTAITSLAASLIFGVCAYPIVAVAEERTVEPQSVTIDVIVKETQDVYSISLTETENGYTAVCDTDESFAYEVTADEAMTTVYCEGGYEEDDATYELSYAFIQSEDGEDNESVLSVTKGADAVEVKISLGASIIYYDAYLEGEEKETLSATLSEDCTSISVAPQDNKAVASSDVMMVKIIIPDQLLIEDFENTLKIAETELFPQIYEIVAFIVMIALAILGIAMLFVAG